KFEDVPFTIQVPEGATAKANLLNVAITQGEHFAIQIELGRQPLLSKKRELQNHEIIVNSRDVVLVNFPAFGTPHHELVTCRDVGSLDLCIKNDTFINNKIIHASRADCLLMLKCARTLARKEPLPPDPAGALKKLGATLTEENGQVTAICLYSKTT